MWKKLREFLLDLRVGLLLGCAGSARVMADVTTDLLQPHRA